MKHIHCISKGIAVAGACLMSAACNDWLDVQPKSQVEDSEMFKSETGFKEALAGVYSSMLSDGTYARELTYGAMGVMGQEWTTYPSLSYGPSYQYVTEYDYSASASEGMIASIWETSYNSIANANNILGHIDGAQKLFTGDNYAIIKGEALALRAFLHFDLLRCFGVSYAVNPDMPSIPYSTDLTYRVFPQLTVRQVAEKVEADLAEAEKLLAVDPILTREEITEMDDNGYLMNRQVHLNYYAVKGLQARVYMWMQRYAEARQCAEAVINSGAFEWVNGDDMSSGADLAFATEQLFALHNVNLSTLNDACFNPDGGNQTFSINEGTWNDYYTDGGDIRYVCLYQPGTESNNMQEMYLKKYNPSTSDDSYYTDKMPLMRLSEMYLIKAECEYRDGDAKAYETWNELRVSRKESPLDGNPADFYDELIKEYRREFIGEGQLFFLYKRLNSPVIKGSLVDVIAEKAYTFPLPMSETDAAQRENNR